MKRKKKPWPNLDDLCAVISMEATAETKDPDKLPLANFLASWNLMLKTDGFVLLLRQMLL
jgi:hypothetical protein